MTTDETIQPNLEPGTGASNRRLALRSSAAPSHEARADVIGNFGEPHE